MAAQGWNVSASAHNIVFYNPPNNGSVIAVTEYATAAQNATDIWALGAWSSDAGYPREVEYFADRKWYAGSRLSPQGLWASRVSAYNDFGKSTPIQDDDALAVTINARQANEIRDLVPLKQLIVMTSATELVVGGGQDDVITPSSISLKPQTYNGCSKISAVVVGNTAIYLQDRGYIMRDLAYTFASDDYSGNNLTVFANHLVEGHAILDIAYQQVPHSIVWMVRDDGILLGLTYMREQEVIGWAHCDTNGTYESVACVSEGGEDVLYCVVHRNINGQSVRYVERMESRLIFDPKRAFFVDAGLVYDGTNNDPLKTMALTGGALWNDTEVLTLTCSSAKFTAASVNANVVLIYGVWVLNDDTGVPEYITKKIRLDVTAYTSPTVVSVRPIGTVPAELRFVPVSTWEYALKTFGGLLHLEGQTVSILSDGNVEPQKIVSGGTVTLELPGSYVVVGLPYRSDFETLEVNVIGQETVRDRKKIIGKVTLICQDTRDIKAGPSVDGPMEEYPARSTEQDYYDPAQTISGIAIVDISGSWSESGRVAVRHEQPLPITILGVIPEVNVGG